jgi:ferredoxin-like protein FixX
MRDKSTYQALRAEGICVDCREPSDRPTKARCTGCAKKLGEAQLKAREERLAAGLCPKCGKAPASALPSRRCPRCEGVVQACPSVIQGTNVTRETRKKAGRCVECGAALEKPEEGATEGGRPPSPRCGRCLQNNAAEAALRTSARRRAGLCRCGQRPPAAGSTQCAPCLARPHRAKPPGRD